MSVDKTDLKLALKGISFDVMAGECFVMLGSNGAGKTTLFKILMSELMPTKGTVDICGYELNYNNLQQIRSLVGYCPQMNSNYSHLTVIEHLQLILSIKNVDVDLRDYLIDYKLKELDLE